MSLLQITNRSIVGVVGAGTLLLSLAAAQAGILPTLRDATPYVQRVDCAVGLHIGPLGGCILGTDNPPVVVMQPAVIVDPNVVVDPAPAVGCATKSVTRTDAAGNSETKTKTNC